MARQIFILPSMLSANPDRLVTEITSLIGENGADGFHFDHMNPPFVPRPTIFVPSLIECLRNSTRHLGDLFFDLHLMAYNPDEVIASFANAGANLITVHYEACPDLRKTLGVIRGLGVKAGLALKPETPVSRVEEFIETLYLLLVMTVDPGKSGQSLIPNCLDKVQEASELINRKAPFVKLQVDGGINLENIGLAAKRGADVFVSGNTVFGSSDRLGTIRSLRARALI